MRDALEIVQSSFFSFSLFLSGYKTDFHVWQSSLQPWPSVMCELEDTFFPLPCPTHFPLRAEWREMFQQYCIEWKLICTSEDSRTGSGAGRGWEWGTVRRRKINYLWDLQQDNALDYFGKLLQSLNVAFGTHQALVTILCAAWKAVRLMTCGWYPKIGLITHSC